MLCVLAFPLLNPLLKGGNAQLVPQEGPEREGGLDLLDGYEPLFSVLKNESSRPASRAAPSAAPDAPLIRAGSLNGAGGHDIL